MSTTAVIEPGITMGELVSHFPGAQRALFRSYHIGGCSSCGFRPDETLADVCARNDNLPVAEVIESLKTAQEADDRMQVSVTEAADLVKEGKAKLVDVRTREEYDAVHIDGSIFMTQELMHQLGGWDKTQQIIFVCHHGIRSLHAIHLLRPLGFVRLVNLAGGIDGWSRDVDAKVPR